MLLILNDFLLKPSTAYTCLFSGILFVARFGEHADVVGCLNQRVG